MNVHEGDQIAAALASAGFSLAQKQETADIIIFNTCTIRNTAEDKIISHIGNVHKEKRKGRPLTIAVVGCLSARDGVEKSLRQKFPLLDIILGTKDITELPKKLNATHTEGKTQSSENTIIINYGCDNYCSYCIVPYVRGELRHRPISEIAEDFQNLAPKQNKITLLGQNVNSYKCPETGANFVGLLERLCPLATNEINFLSSHPRDWTPELTEFIAKTPQMSRDIHLPVQSGSDKILELMNRGYTATDYKTKVDFIRKLIPDARITTDIICGFPGETEDDFTATIDFVRELRFNAAFIFPYSRRSGTKADTMAGQLDTKIKKSRATKLINIQKEISKCLSPQ